MLGAIAGDIIGSIYEARPIKTRDFPLFDERCRFTDDTVLTLAVADAIMSSMSYRSALLDYGRRYPDAGFGASFISWLHTDDPQPYHSWGNGAAMRVSPVGWAFTTEDEVLCQAKMTAEVSHDHPEGIKGAQASALAVFFARRGVEKEKIRQRITNTFGYDLSRSVEAIRAHYTFDVSCQGTVPEAIVAFLDACSYEDAVRNAVSLGGDSDTLACITGGIAEAFYGGVGDEIAREVYRRLPADLGDTVRDFRNMYA